MSLPKSIWKEQRFVDPYFQTSDPDLKQLAFRAVRKINFCPLKLPNCGNLLEQSQEINIAITVKIQQGMNLFTFDQNVYSLVGLENMYFE